MAVTFKTKHEIGFEIFIHLDPDTQSEVAKHLLNERFYIIEKVFSTMSDKYRYKFLMDYNLKKLKKERDWNHMRNTSHYFFHFNLRYELPTFDPDLDLYTVCGKNDWEFICEHNERLLFEWRKNDPDKCLYPRYEERFLEEFYKTSCHIRMLKKYEEERCENDIDEFLDRDNKFTKYDHYDWCVFYCTVDHSRELQYRNIYFDKLRQESVARAVRIAIKRFGKVFKKNYPDYKPMMDKMLFDRLYFLLNCHVKNRDIIYELELELISLANHIKFTPLTNSNIYELETELIPFTDRLYQIKYLVEENKQYDN